MPDLSSSDLDQLRRLVGRMIPASPAHDAPGADDPAIFTDIVALLRAGPAPLDGLLSDFAGAGLDDAQPSVVEATLGELRQRHGGAFAAVVMAVAQGYYRDDRVMRSLGMEARPPFPKGHEISEGDWTLLDAVRERAPIWRKVD